MTDTDEMPKEKVWAKQSRVEKMGAGTLLGHFSEANLSFIRSSSKRAGSHEI